MAGLGRSEDLLEATKRAPRERCTSMPQKHWHGATISPPQTSTPRWDRSRTRHTPVSGPPRNCPSPDNARRRTNNSSSHSPSGDRSTPNATSAKQRRCSPQRRSQDAKWPRGRPVCVLAISSGGGRIRTSSPESSLPKRDGSQHPLTHPRRELEGCHCPARPANCPGRPAHVRPPAPHLECSPRATLGVRQKGVARASPSAALRETLHVPSRRVRGLWLGPVFGNDP